MNTTLFEIFPSVNALVEDIHSHSAKLWTQRRERSRWSGGQTLEESASLALRGCLQTATLIEPLIERALSLVDIPVRARARIHDVAGGCPDVPAYLMGEPEHFNALRVVESEATPVRVFVPLVCSAAISADKIAERGAAIAAFCIALGTVRPVQLYGYTAGDGKRNLCVQLATAPFVASEVGYCLTSPAFMRQVCYGWLDTRDWSGAWADWSGYGQRCPRQAIGAADEDLVLDYAFSADGRIADADKWLRETLARYIGEPLEV